MLVSGDSSVIDVKPTPAKKLLAHKETNERDCLVLITQPYVVRRTSESN